MGRTRARRDPARRDASVGGSQVYGGRLRAANGIRLARKKAATEIRRTRGIVDGWLAMAPSCNVRHRNMLAANPAIAKHIAAVAIHATACKALGEANWPMTARLRDRSCSITMTGAAATPFSTALQ